MDDEMTEDERPAAHLDKSAEQFLIVEFESQRELRGNLNARVAAGSNTFVAILAASFVGLSFLGQAIARESGVAYPKALYLATIGVLLVDAMFGWTTFRQVVSCQVTAVRYDRSMSRIRRYYVERYPDLTPSLSANIYDDRPVMGPVESSESLRYVLSGDAGLIATLASVCIGAVAGVGILAAHDAGLVARPRLESGWDGTLLTGLIVLGAFSASLYQFARYATRRFRWEEALWVSHFPEPRSMRRND